MKLLAPVFLLFCLSIGHAWGQTETVYKKLKTKKVYSVNGFYQSGPDGTTYEINGKEVDEKTYNKYASTYNNMADCCPCILQSYDIDDVLLDETVSCTDCGVGWFKEYYPNGNIKSQGAYRENPTENWEDIWEDGYCSVPNGEWIFFDEKGVKRYSDFWDNGTFIKQDPEQDSVEIWKIGLTLNGINATALFLQSDQLKELEITPYFKNSMTDSTFRINLTVSSKNRNNTEWVFTSESFKKLDLDSLLIENGFTDQDEISYDLTISHNNRNYGHFSLSIESNLPVSLKKNNIDSDRKQMPVDNDFSDLSDEEVEIYLVNSMDPTKKITLKNGLQNELFYELDFLDSLIESKSTYLQGTIESVSDTSLTFKAWSEASYVNYVSGYESDINTTYTSEYSVQIPINQIEYLQYSSPARGFFHSFGGTIAGLSALTTLFVAPLASINFKTGNFNKNRYYAIAGSGLLGLAVSIPISSLSKPKQYRLLDKDSDPEKGYWYVESKILE